MQRSITRVNRLFTVTIVGLCVVSMACLLLVLYVSSGISYTDRTSPAELSGLTAGYPAVAEYLQEQKASEAHFVTLANLIKDDQQRLIGKTALFAAVPVLIASALLGYLLARYLLRPVAEAYESQERFLQDAAHELRNPLATMSAVLQQARQSGANPGGSFDSLDSASGQLAILERQTNHLVRINEDLLFLERKVKKAAEPVNITELTRDVAETLQPIANKRNVKVFVQGKAVRLTIHPDDYICLIRNLMENAIKYSKDTTASPRGKVTVTLVATAKTTSVQVKDTGIGIPSSDIEHIGKRFYRGTNVARRDGSGLGFAIVRKIAADYDADIAVESTLGKGTTISVSFKS